MRKQPKRIGLAIIGAGRVGLIRGELAARHPEVDWIGIAEINPERGEIVREKCGADFVTADFRELLARPEVNAVVVSTDEHLHVAPVVLAAERKLPMPMRSSCAFTAAFSRSRSLLVGFFFSNRFASFSKSIFDRSRPWNPAPFSLILKGSAPIERSSNSWMPCMTCAMSGGSVRLRM